MEAILFISQVHRVFTKQKKKKNDILCIIYANFDSG